MKYKMIRDKKGRFIKGRYKPIRLCIYCNKNERRIKRKYCSRKCFTLAIKGRKSHRKGKTLDKEYGKEKAERIRKKMSKASKGRMPHNFGKKMPQYSGEKHWNWQGGITKLNWQIRESLEYKIWQRKVFERDDFTCQMCGKRGGGTLHADHIESFNEILKKYHIKTLNQALPCKKLWDIKNGRTLCKPCHKTTDSYPKNLRYATV